MLRTVTCLCGHCWECDGDALAPDELDALCPECSGWLLTPPPERSPGACGGLFRRTAPTTVVNVPGYEILTVLGDGGMGVVYKARQLALDRVVAVKLVRPAVVTGSLFDRFRTEAEACAAMQHPNIVRVYEVGEADGLPFLVLEYVNGGTLAARLARSPLTPRAAAAVVGVLARAVGYAHNCGVVHRDLKPSNVLLEVAPDADPDLDLEHGLRLGVVTPKVSDFGLAKRMNHGDQTATGAVLGTPSYMAPEQALGASRDAGPAVDVYALGAVLYECLTGRPPFRAATPLETLDLVRHAEPIPPDRFQPKLPRDLQTICLKCLEKNPARRYASAAELADDLDRFGLGLPVRARPVGLAGWAVRWAKRRPAMAALAGVVGLAVAGGVGGLFAHNARLREEVERTQKQEAETARQKTAALDHVRRGHQALDDIFTSLDNPPVGLRENAEFQAHYHDQARVILRYYHDILREGDDTDPEVRFGRGLVAVYAGRMQLRLGAAAAAEADFRRAAALLEPLAADPTAAPAVRQEWAECCYWFGTLYQKTGRGREAARSFATAAETATALISADPTASRDRRALALCHTRLAEIELTAGRHAEAEGQARAAAVGWDLLTAAEPTSDIHRAWAAISLYYLAEIHWHAGQWDALEDDTRRAEIVLGEYARRPPRTVAESDTIQRVGHIYRNHAHGLFARENTAAGIDRLTAAIGLLDTVMQSNPTSVHARYDAALLHRDRAYFRGVVGPADEAFADWDRAIALADGPFALGCRIERAMARLNVGDVTEAVNELNVVAEDNPLDGVWANGLGRAFARAAGIVPDPMRDELATKAVAALRRAAEKGHFRDRDEFRQFLSEPVFDSIRMRAEIVELERLVGEKQSK